MRRIDDSQVHKIFKHNLRTDLSIIINSEVVNLVLTLTTNLKKNKIRLNHSILNQTTISVTKWRFNLHMKMNQMEIN